MSDNAATYLVESAGALRMRRSRLIVEKGPDKKDNRELDSETLTVGTGEGSNFRLSDPTISRVHFSITAGPHGFLLTDLGSTNGTTIDDLRVREAYLKHGSRIAAGHTRLKFEFLTGEMDLDLDSEESFDELLGRSAVMRRLFSILRKVGPSNAPVLLLGESGTGKELAARAIHNASTRAGGSFVVVDCGALPPGLVESELFGHLRGSFTGAVADRKGAFELADGGTILLDEIGELPIDLQPKLLRALEAREVRPVGAGEVLKIDVRLLAATSRDLRQEVNRGAFRSDLYFRLAVVPVTMPPLRDRPDDIPLLVSNFAQEFAQRSGAAVKTIPAEVVQRFTQRMFPGNVRELRNEVERFLALGEDMMDQDYSPTSVRSSSGVHIAAPAVDVNLPFKIAKQTWIEPFEREYLKALVTRFSGNLTQAAREAGLDRNYLSTLLKRHSLR